LIEIKQVLFIICRMKSMWLSYRILFVFSNVVVKKTSNLILSSAVQEIFTSVNLLIIQVLKVAHTP
jgi:hypothetical protein